MPALAGLQHLARRDAGILQEYGWVRGGLRLLFLGSNLPRGRAAALVAHNDVDFVVQSIEASNQTIDRKLA
jgi:hypothetical protein